MTRIDRARFDAARFPVSLTVPTRFDDLDIQGHVNNAAAVVMLQEGRVRFNKAAELPHALGTLRAMIAGLNVEFAGEIRHPDPVEIETGVVAIGRTSFRVGQVARQAGRTCLYSEATMVFADASGAAPIPEMLRSALERMMIDDPERKG